MTSTTVGNGAPVTATYSNAGDGYDEHGNMLKMPQLQLMQWNERDQLQMTQRQAVNQTDADGVQRQGERTWYVYDAGGQRIRKVTELANGQVKDERLYLAGFEVYRKPADNLVRETLHVMDDTQRIAMVETRTQGNEPGIPQELARYQLTNHLGSGCLEVDDQARVLSYEEYTPYGSRAYQAVRSQIQTPKRYRFTGMERDEESGLGYHSARYYAPWLGRWTSADPIGVLAGTNAYSYVRGNPITRVDPLGLEDQEPETSSSSKTASVAREVHRKAVSIQANVITPAKIVSAYQDAKEVLRAHNKLSQDLKQMNKALRKLNNRIHKSGGGPKIQAQGENLQKAIAKAQKLLKSQKDSVRAANKLVQAYPGTLTGLKGAALRKVGEYAVRFQKVVAGTKMGQQIFKYGRVLTHPAVQRGLMVVGGLASGVHSYLDSTNKTQTGKLANAALGAGSGTLVMANPVVALADHFSPEGYKLSEVYHGGSNAVTAIGEGIATGDTRAMDDFHSRSKRGDFGKVMQVSSEAGDFWAEKGIVGGLKEFGREFWSLF